MTDEQLIKSAFTRGVEAHLGDERSLTKQELART